MTTRRLFAVGLLISGLSLISWVRAENSPQESSCEPIIAAETDEDCAGGNHDQVLTRYRTNQTRHWRHMVVSSR